MHRFKNLFPLLVIYFWLAINSRAVAAGLSSTDPAPEFGVTPGNTHVSQYDGVYSNPHVLWSISHQEVTIDAPALVLDSRGILYSQWNSPVWAATGQPVAALSGINFWRDSVPAIDSAGDLFHWEQGTLHAYNSAGTPLWTEPSSNSSDGMTVKLGPDGTIYAATEGGGVLSAYQPNGTLKWTAPSAVTVGNYPPAIDSSGNTYWSAGYVSGTYASYDPNGNLRWQFPWSQSWNTDPVILGPDGNLYCSEDYGTEVYVRSTSTGQVLRQQPNLYGGIQAISPSGTLYSTSYHTVEATNLYGNVDWVATVPSSIYIDHLTVDANGDVYCTTEENQLLAFSPQGAELWSLALPASDWQSLGPVIGPDGTIYVEDGNRLMAIAGTVVPEPTAVLLPLATAVSLLKRRKR